MIAALNEKQQRWLAIAIFVVFCAAVLAVTALPLWFANATHQAKIDQMQDRLQQLLSSAQCCRRHCRASTQIAKTCLKIWMAACGRNLSD